MVKYLGLEMKFKPSCGDRLESGSARVLLLLSSEDVFWKPTDAGSSVNYVCGWHEKKDATSTVRFMEKVSIR